MSSEVKNSVSQDELVFLPDAEIDTGEAKIKVDSVRRAEIVAYR